MRFGILGILLFFGFGSIAQEKINAQLIDEILDSEVLENASFGMYVVDSKTNEVLLDINAKQSLVPASVTKLVTTAVALELLGTKTRFETSIAYTGSIDTLTNILHGNIIIKGGGDPCLGSHRYEKHYGNFIENWAEKIKALGIDSVNGKVIGDASYFTNEVIPSTWIWGDLGNYYGAGVSGLTVYENRTVVSFKSGDKEGDPTSITGMDPEVPGLFFENKVESRKTNKDEAYFYGAPNQYNRLVTGGIPLNRSGFEVKSSIPDPSMLIAYQLKNKLADIGVKVKTYSNDRIEGELTDSMTTILTLKSPYLSDIVRLTNMHSINLYAEHLLQHIAIKYAGESATDKGTNSITSFLSNKMDTRGFYLNDGSGLSRFNGFTSKHLVGVLQMMKHSEYYTAFNNSLPVAAESGTLRSMFKSTYAAGKIRAKSGYMTRVRSYAGYATTKKGREIVFAVIVNNYNCSAYQMKKKLEKILLYMVESL